MPDHEHFSPDDLKALFRQDDDGSTHGWWPATIDPTFFKTMTDTALAEYVRACRNCLLLPLSDGFLWGIMQVTQEAEGEARRRLRRKAVTPRKDTWESADLVSEVQAAGVWLVRRGNEWWGKCPFHGGGNERTPSFAVHPVKKTWHCHACDASGGVYEWRRRIKG